MSAHKSMTVRFFIHSVVKRAKATTLLDSGATENFMNLSYTKWLKLPIKELAQPRKLFNVDNTKNVSGELKHYTDLQVQTGTKGYEAAILPNPYRRAKSHIRIPMVCHQPTKDRLEARMDRPHSTTHHFLSWQCKTSHFYPTMEERTTPHQSRSIFYWKRDDPSKANKNDTNEPPGWIQTS